MVLETLMIRGRNYTCSYEEEAAALHLAIEWTSEECSDECKVLICTDSQSLCRSITGLDPDITKLRMKCSRVAADLTIQWVPGHSQIAGNELADKAANDARLVDGLPGAISYGSICSIISSRVKKKEKLRHQRT